MPFIANLETCQRDATNGLTFFRPMVGEYPAQIAQTLQDNIASTTAENYRFSSRLKQVQAELDSQRDTRFLDLSLENRDLKEKVEKLQGIQKQLDDVNAKVSEQAKQLEELPKAKAERDQAQQAEKELKEESARLRQEVEELSKAKAEAERREAAASVGGFQQAVNLTGALVPCINWKLFGGKHYAMDKTIWLGNKMVFDPALHRSAEEEEEEEEEGSPEKGNAGDDKVEDKGAGNGVAKEGAEDANV